MTELRVMLSAAIMLSLTACGLSGDLYLPEDETPPETPSSIAATPATGDDEDETNGSSPD